MACQPGLGLGRSRRGRLLSLAPEAALLTAALAASGYLLWQLLAFEYGRDQGIYAMVADVMLRGGAPYRDAWDFKPPGIFFVYAGVRAVLGKDMQAIRIFEAAAFVSLLWAFAIFSRRHTGTARAGILGGTLAIFNHVQLGFWGTGQPESFGAVAVAWALVCATYEPGAADPSGWRKRWAAWAGAGALYGVAILMKPPLGGGILVSAGVVGLSRWRSAGEEKRGRALTSALLAFGAGASLPLVLTWLYFLAHGALGNLYQALFVFAPSYTRINFRPAWFVSFFFQVVQELLFKYSWFNVVGLGLLIGLPALHRRQAEGVVHVAGALAPQLVGIALQAKFFDYHYGAALSLLGLLAGWGYWKLRLVGRRTGVGIAALVLLGYLLYDVQRPEASKQLVFRTPKPRPEFAQRYNASRRRVAQWLATHTPPDSSLFIWGFEPVIYDLSGRHPASRYIYNVPQRAAWTSAESRAELMRDLARSRPAAVVVDTRDSFRWVTGSDLSSAGALKGFPALRRLLARQYELAARIDRFEVYARKSQPRPVPRGPGGGPRPQR